MKTKRNIVTEGLSGKAGQLVFRQRFGKTIVSRSPVFKANGLSIAQTQVRLTFKDAVRYGKAVNADPVQKAAYLAVAKPGQTAFNLAIADFFKPPVIGSIEHDGYNGQAGAIIKIYATDDFLLKEVAVKIETAAGVLAEQGNAVPAADGLHWVYSTTAINAAVTGSIITVTATDTPNHRMVKQKTI